MYPVKTNKMNLSSQNKSRPYFIVLLVALDDGYVALNSYVALHRYVALCGYVKISNAHSMNAFDEQMSLTITSP